MAGDGNKNGTRRAVFVVAIGSGGDGYDYSTKVGAGWQGLH